MKKIVRDMSTPESREFWESAKRMASEAQKWPEWKRAGINVAEMRDEPRETVSTVADEAPPPEAKRS